MYTTRNKYLNNKWINAALPALLLHISIGTVYCWSIFSQEIADYIGHSQSSVEWAFSFAIFFLGISASFLGNIVEKDIHKSSLIATLCFSIGMAGTGFFIYYGGIHQGSITSLLGIYLCYGLIMGIGLGTGYLSPVKTLMLWFSEHKGLATGLAVAGFGAAKAIASPIMQYMLDNLGNGGIYKMFYILSVIYFILMFIGHLLLKKPDDWHEAEKQDKSVSVIEVIKTRTVLNYIGIWLMFYINITCGLALLSQEKAIFKCLGLTSMIGLLSTISAIFNASGRLGFSIIGDKLKDRNTVFKIIFLISIILTGLSVLTNGIITGIHNTFTLLIVLLLIMGINAGYGGGFSTIPTLLSEHYGMNNISTIHGITLSAWAFAGLSGNQLASFIINQYGVWIESKGTLINPLGYQYLLIILLILYIIAFLISTVLIKKSANQPKV